MLYWESVEHSHKSKHDIFSTLLLNIRRPTIGRISLTFRQQIPLHPSITTQRIPQRGNARDKKILAPLHRHTLLEPPQSRIQILLIITMQRNTQHSLPLRLPNHSIKPGLRRWEPLVIRPRPLYELETVFQAGLVAGEEKAAGVFWVGGRLGGVVVGAVGDAVADHAGHFHGVGIGARVGFADVGAEGAGVFGNAFVAEIVVEAGFGRGVFGWVDGDGVSC